MTKRLIIPLLFLAMLISLLPSCEREKLGAIDYTYQPVIEKAPTTKAFYYVNQPYMGKLALNVDPRNESRIETAFLTDANGYALIGEDKKKILPNETFTHDYRESAIPIEIYLTTIGTNEIRFDFMSERFSASATDTIQVKDLHYTITVDSLPDKMLVGKKFSFRLNIEEKEQTDNTETTASGTITKGAGIMYVAGDKILVSKPNEIVTDLKDVLPETITKAGGNVQTLTIGKNVLTYLPQLDELNEINLKINNPYQSSQNFSMSFNIEKPVFGTEAIIDKKSIPYVRKDYSFLLKVSQVDVYEGNTYSLTYRFLKSSAKLKINATDLHQGETLRIKEGENIVVINSEIKENCDIEFVVSDKYGSQYKDTAVIDFQALPMYNVVVPESEGGTIVGPGSYEESSTATLMATANTGYTFTGFYTPDNTLISSNPEYSFTVLEDKTIKAIFKKNIYKIDAIAGEGGSVTGGNSYEFASNVTLKAKPNNGYSFAGWYEAEQLVSADETYSFQAAGHRSLIGRFKLNKLSLATDPVSKECSTGEAVSFNLTLNEDGYTGTFKVFYQAVSGEGTFSGKESQVLAKGSHAMRYTPERAGTHTLNFRAVDDNGQEETVNITITAAATDLKASCNLTETTIKQNETADLSMTIEEENHPKKFALTYGLSNGTGKLLVNGTELGNTSTVELAAGNHKLRYTASNVGTATLKFTIADARGQKKEVATKVISKADIKATAGEHGSVTGSGAYALNEKVNLQATPETGYGFSGWFENGTNVSNDDLLTFPATASRTLQARFGTNLYKVSVIAGDGGTVTGSGSYEFGTQQTITATPATGYSFDSWSDHTEESETPRAKARAATTDNAIKRVITITAENKSYIAAFKKNQYVITVKAGEGGTASGGGTFDFGSDHTITATAKDGYRFEKWSDNNSEASRSIRVGASDATYNAEFTTNKYEIKLIAGEGGTVTGAGFYNFGTEPTITATAKDGYRFVRWDDGNTNPSRQIRVGNKDASYVAEFSPNKYEVKVIAGEGGTVTGEGLYDFGTEQIITATAKTGYTFSRWADDKVEATTYKTAKTFNTAAFPTSANEAVKRTIVIRAATVTYTAEFSANKYLLNVTAGEGGSASGTGTYPYGSKQTITATPKTGYKFVKWDDGDTNPSRQVTIGATDRTYTASFAVNQYVIEAVSDGNGTVSGGKAYDFGEVATLRATAKAGYNFAGWHEGGKKISDDNPYSFAVSKERSITAKFEISEHFVTVTSGGNGTVTGSGLYKHGAQATITAKANTGYSFSRWNDDNTETSRVILVDKDITYVGLFSANKYPVTVNAGTGGTVTGSGSYDYGTLQTITATASTGYTFTRWSDGDRNSIRNIVVGSTPITYTAEFTPNKYVITVTSGTGGTAAGGGSYDFATQQTITATASTGYSFTKWDDGNTEANRKIIIGAEDKTYTATFTPNKYVITVTAGTGGTVSGGGSYNYATQQTITATAATGYSFTQWSDGSTDASRRITIGAENKTYTATFTPNKYVITVTGGAGGTVSGSGSYDYGTRQTITATPSTGYHFVRWDDGDTQASRQISIGAENKSYAATFAINQYAIDATAGAGGTVKGGGTYNHGATVTLTATPNNGYSFSGWSEVGTNVSNSASYSFEATKSRTLLASFRKNEITAGVDKPSQAVKVGQAAPVQLSISEPNYEGLFTVKYDLVSGSGTFSGGASQTVGAGNHAMSYTPSTAGTHTYQLTVIDQYGTNKTVNVTVTATLSPIVLQPNQTSFSLGLNGEATVSLAISEVAYSDKFTLRYDHSGASGTFKVNDLVLASGLTTSVSAGTATLKFQIGQVGDANLRITVSDTRGQSEAVNIKVNATSTISVSAGAGGSASGGGTYSTLGATATVTASPATGYSFAGWYEGGTYVSGNASYGFTVTNSRALEARFTVNSYTLTVVANPAAGGTVSGSGTYPYGSSQTITASPATSYSFTAWSDGNGSASRTVSIGAANATYTANFTYNKPADQPVSCKINGSGSVLINGQPLVNETKYAPGTYTLTAVPASGWSASWTTKQITVVDRRVDESVTFTQNVQSITITLSNGYDVSSGRNYYYVQASSPVTTTITVKAVFRYKEENTCSGYIIYDLDKEITITLSPGQKSGNDWIDATGSDSCISVSINHKSTSTPWNGQTISGATYTVSGGF